MPRPRLYPILLLLLLFLLTSAYAYPYTFWLNELDVYLSSHTYPIPTSYKTYTGVALGSWASRQRSLHTSGTLSHSRLSELNARSFPFSNLDYTSSILDVRNPLTQPRITYNEDTDIQYVNKWMNGKKDEEWYKDLKRRFWKGEVSSSTIKQVEILGGQGLEIWGRKTRGKSKRKPQTF
ncbi:hypothetical protein TL16_g11066 [Triparma laevis f. inornata]|uniref:Uncharacterized protein n=1 Tax=Triparma laevis f. inornata TaxID=1714386 RepID=A0A9W7BHS2_9STRA|nr:hypothetical protein TL16_g11066 [Triparma laevis f. inornata]